MSCRLCKVLLQNTAVNISHYSEKKKLQLIMIVWISQLPKPEWFISHCFVPQNLSADQVWWTPWSRLGRGTPSC